MSIGSDVLLKSCWLYLILYNTKEVSVEKVEIPSETVNTNSEEAVIHVDENKQKPTVKSEENDFQDTVCTKTLQCQLAAMFY
jgi:hypothetical protein